MSPLGISLLLLLALAGFALLSWRKLQVVLALQPEVRWDQPGQRLRSVLVNGFLQQRMVQREWRPGLMHAVIFLGFMSLLLRKLQLLAIGYDETAVFPDGFGGPFAAFKDGIELAVIGAVLYAYWRRFVTKPARLERNREAWLVLGLILVIMLTDLAFDGFRFTLLSASVPGVAHEHAFAWAGAVVASAVKGLSPGALQAGYVFFYWAQMVVVLSFLVLLPVGEHFHIVTALPTLFFRRGRPANQVPKVDIDKLMEATDEADMHAGVRTARDLVWKDGLDVFTCTECGRCKDACPTHLTGKPLSMKTVNDSLKHHLVEQRALILAGDPNNELPALVGPVISEDTLWACTSCGYCEAACPIELEHLPRFFRMRQHQVMIAGEFPHELKKVFEAYESQSNPWGLQAAQRADWAQGLDVPLVRSAEDMAGLDCLFYVGSAMSFDPRGQKIARAFVSVLQHAGVRFGILGPDEGSTGECVRRVGNEMLFQQLAATLVETLNERGVKRIVTCDPHALNSLRNEYPEFGGHYELVHHTQLIAELLAQGRLKLTPALEKVVFHDPCYLGRHNGEFDAPRAVLGQLCRDAPLEMARSREKAMCCGAGGGRMWMEETIGQRINVTRVEQALALQPQTIATACPYCAVMMADGLAALPAAGATQSRDIAELVADALVVSAPG
jgi:Fe-S oxidoreductase